MNEDQIYAKIHKNFVKAMMCAPQVPLNLEYYRELLDNTVSKFLEEFSNEEEAGAVETVRNRIAEEFVWFNSGIKMDEKDAGYFKNLNAPKKLYGKELYEVLKIENNKQEQQMADKLYGTGEEE
jgi:hypothetical protein